MDEIFAKRIGELIRGSGLKHEELAKKLGFSSKGTISKYARGQITNIGPTSIRRLAEFFEVSPSWLAGFTDDKYYNIDVKNK